MPVVGPSFQQPQAPDTGEEIQLQSGTNNWMTQAAQRAQMGATLGQTQANTSDIQAQTEQRQAGTAQLNAVLPAVIAKAQADQLASTNDIAAATATQQMRGQFQSLKPQVIQDLAQLHDPNNIPKEADGTPDWNQIYNSYEGLQAKYSGLSLLPEGKQYYDMIEQGKKDAFEMAAKHATAQLTLNQLKLASQYNLNNREAVIDKTAATNAATKPAVAQTEALNTQRNQAFNDISTARDTLSRMGFSLDQLGQDVQGEQAHPFAHAIARVAPGLAGTFSPAVKQVSSDIGDFVSDIMSKVKNIRNFPEFSAVTASLVKPDQPDDVQNRNLDKLKTMQQVLSQRTDIKEQALRADPNLSPDEADKLSIQKVPFPSNLMSSNRAITAGGLTVPKISTPQDAAKLPSGTHFLDPNGVERVVP